MSQSHQPKHQKRNNKKHKKHTVEQENEVQVTKPLENLQYPSHLSQVNYLSIDSLQATIDDQLTHEIYYQVIMENQDIFAGRTVLHITQGVNCLYSIFAARAGSKKVYCVINDKSEREVQNVFMMKQVVKQNRLEDQIQVLLWKDFNAQVDIIVGQPMGYCLHFDGLLERIIQARDLYLTKNGMIFPNNISFKCAALHDEYFSDHKVNYWDDVYGIPMKSMKKWISHQPLIRVVDPTLIVSKVSKILNFNLETLSIDEIKQIDRVFQIDLLGPCHANGIVLWFQAFFDHSSQKKDLKGSPWAESTKYTQVTLYWPEILEFKNGGKLRIRLKGQKNLQQGFTLLTTKVNNQLYQYTFS